MSIQPKSVVTVFVRHRESCSHQSRGEFYRGCQCSKFLRYSRNGKQKRQAAGTRTWSVAEDKAVELQEQLDRGDTPKPIIVKGPQPTIADCIDTFITKKETKNISARRVKKLRLQLDQFEAFMSGRSKLFPSLITAADVIDFRASWEKVWTTTTRQKAQQNVRGFLRTCCRENLNDLLAALDTIQLSKKDKERLKAKPFTEKEIKELFDQIPKTFEPEKVATATLLVKFMISTGTAIRDTVQLKRRSIQDGWLKFDRQKTDRRVKQHLDPVLYQELLASGNGEHIFWNGKYQVTSAVTTWQDDIRLLMQNAGVWIEGNTTHRFRDTFVSDALSRGWSLEDVADALGDTLAIVEKHYKDEYDARQDERLKSLPKRSWAKQGAQA